MTEQEFKTGDVVRLKSGGPMMTVASNVGEETPGAIEVAYFDAHGTMNIVEIFPAMVERVMPVGLADLRRSSIDPRHGANHTDTLCVRQVEFEGVSR